MTIQADVPPRTAAEPASTLCKDSEGSEDSGDPASEDPIEVIYRLHGKPLYRFLLRITLGDHRQAEDLLQETLFRAWRFLQNHTADVTRLRPWLYTVARRVAIDAARARQARPAEVIVTHPDSLPAAHDDIEQMLVVLTIRRGLMSLTPDHRRVLIEVFYRGRTAAEAAAALGIPEGTVRSRVFYALRALGAVTGLARPKCYTRSASLASLRDSGPPKRFVSWQHGWRIE
jgi:RNA polymerase sigma-70 factor, ECF subfamily